MGAYPRNPGPLCASRANGASFANLREVRHMDSGNTAFLLIAAALVLLMTPGLAFFYGGLVKAKSVISMMMMSFGAIGLIGVLWVLYGYAIAFPGAEGTIFA